MKTGVMHQKHPPAKYASFISITPFKNGFVHFLSGTSGSVPGILLFQDPDHAAPAAAAPAASGLKELTLAVDSEPSTLDSVMDTSDDCALIATGAVFEKLVECSAEDDIILELAESFEVSEDATEWTYHLRQGIKFHNGKEMTSEDVVASLNRWLDKRGEKHNSDKGGNAQ